MIFVCLFNIRYAMEIHIVHYKAEYGSFKNAQNYSDGVCVVGFFGKVICDMCKYIVNFVCKLN